MKKVIVLLYLCVICTGAYSQYYYYNGIKIQLSLNTGYIYITTSHATNNIQLSQILGNDFQIISAGFDNTSQEVISIDKSTTQPPKLIRAYIKIKSTLSESDYLALIEKLKANPNIDYVAQSLSNNEVKLGISHLFFVRLKDGDNSIANIITLATKNHLKILGQNRYMPEWYILSCDKNSTGNSMEMAALFYESGYFKYSEPDFINCTHLCSPTCTNNDTLFPLQWGLLNTGQTSTTIDSTGIAGVDIKACAAWQITTGDPGIKTAIIDNGYDLNHPDLAANNVGIGFDEFIPLDRGQGSYIYINQSNNQYGHGTNCAGIIAAVQNNLIGISGVAPASSIMSVSYPFDWAAVSLTELADGINWAWHNGADVLSNSWVIDGITSSLIESAIKNAIDSGRNGLGCVVVFAAGNGDVSDSVSYPAKFDTAIIAVGAVDRCGIRSSNNASTRVASCDPWCPGNPTACDPGSCFGSQLSVVAPGSNISTTDVSADEFPSNGHAESTTDSLESITSETYTNTFGGTSAACPHVAGVAALILSVNPCLTHTEVKRIIELTAQKITQGSYTYAPTSGHPNGNWNNELGYGLVSAGDAVALASTIHTGYSRRIKCHS